MGSLVAGATKVVVNNLTTETANYDPTDSINIFAKIAATNEIAAVYAT